MSSFIVELEQGVYLATWDGDPGRTKRKCFAKKFKRRLDAEKALEKAREYRPFKGKVI